MSILDIILPGVVFIPGIFGQLIPGGVPIQAPQNVLEIQLVGGVAYVPVPGPQGLPGNVAGTLPYTSITGTPSLSYLYLQSQPSAFWDITHSLGYYPAVTAMDSAGSVVQGDIQHLSANHLTLTFSAAFSGQASLT